MSKHPYIGLRPFTRDETALFFGREQHTNELIDRLGQQHFVAIIGNSGGGKSSLVKTGLIPKLEAASLPNGWRIVDMHPGKQPFLALANGLLTALEPELKAAYTAETLAQRLCQDPLSLHGLLAAHPLPGNTPLLIVCDSFEELFSDVGQGADLMANDFVNLLLASSQPSPGNSGQPPHGIYVVITLRADFLGDCAQFAGLAEAINQGLYLLPRLNAQQLCAAIAEPAKVCGGEIEPALISRLVDAAATHPDPLPLLQYLLMRLWDTAADKQHITLVDYENLGGLDHALSRHADEAYNTLNQRQQKLAKLLFSQLTGLDSQKRATRRPLTLRKLVQLSNKTYKEVVTVLDVFRQSGRSLLVPPISLALTAETDANLNTVIDLSHESLIRHWQPLSAWAQAEAKHAETYRHWLEAAERWQRGEAALLPAPEVDRARAWLDDFKPTVLWAVRYLPHKTRSGHPSDPAAVAQGQDTDEQAYPLAEAELSLVVEYIQQSQAAKQSLLGQQQQAQQCQLKQARLISAGATVGLLIAVALAVWAWQERQQAQTAKINAETGEHLRTGELFQAQLTEAALLAKSEDYAGAKKVLQETYALEKDIPAAQLRQRNLLASFSDMKGGGAEQVYQGAGVPLFAVAVSPDGHTLAAAGEHGAVVIFDVKTGKLLQRLQGHATEGGPLNNSVLSIAFTPNGGQLISAGLDKKIIVWQRGSDNLFGLKTSWWAADKVVAIAISPDGLSLASGDDRNISLWDLATGKLKATLKKHTLTIAEHGLSFSATGEWLASASFDGTAIIWQVASGKPMQVLQGHTGHVSAVAFSADGKTLLTGSQDKTLRLWEVSTGKVLGVLNGHANRVLAVSFLGNGDTLLSSGADRSIRLWDGRSGVSLRLFQGHTSGVDDFALYAGQLFSASNDGTVRRWALASPYQQTVDLSNKVPESAAISPTGNNIAVGFASGLLQLYSLPDLQLLWANEKAHSGNIFRLSFNKEGDLLASAGFNDLVAKIWHISNNDVTEQQTFGGHTDVVYGVAISPDNQTLATASYDGTIGLFQLNTDKKQFIQAHTQCQRNGCTEAVSFNKDGTKLLSNGHADRSIKLWDLQSHPPSLIKEFPKASAELLWSSLSPDNQLISTAGREQVVTVINTQTQQAISLVGHEQSIFKSLFTPDSATLASVSGDATVKFWAIQQGNELFTLRLPTHSGYPTPMWDFDFRCQETCRVAVPLTAGKLLLYQLAYQDNLDFAHDNAEQKRTALALWQDYLNLTATLLEQNALPAAQQAYRETEELATLAKPLREKSPDDMLIQQSSMQSFQLQAKLQQHLGKFPESLATYQQALVAAEKWFANTNDKTEAFEHLLAMAKDYTNELTANHQADQATAIQQRVLALPLADINSLYFRAQWAKGLSNQAATDKDLLQAAKLVNPQNAEELNAIGYGLITLSNRYQEAYPLLKQAITLAPDNVNIMDSIGWVLYKLGNAPEALTYFQQAYCKQAQLSEESAAHRRAVLAALGLSKQAPPLCLSVQVDTVKPDSSSAETPALKADDLIIRYAGKPVTDVTAFTKILTEESPDAPPKKLEILRQGQTLSFMVRPDEICALFKSVTQQPYQPGSVQGIKPKPFPQILPHKPIIRQRR